MKKLRWRSAEAKRERAWERIAYDARHGVKPKQRVAVTKPTKEKT